MKEIQYDLARIGRFIAALDGEVCRLQDNDKSEKITELENRIEAANKQINLTISTQSRDANNLRASVSELKDRAETAADKLEANAENIEKLFKLVGETSMYVNRKQNQNETDFALHRERIAELYSRTGWPVITIHALAGAVIALAILHAVKFIFGV